MVAPSRMLTGDRGEGERWWGEVGGKDRGDGGNSKVTGVAILAVVVGDRLSLVFSSEFSSWSAALSNCSWVLTDCNLLFSSNSLCLSDFNCWINVSISSVWAFFLSLAV